MSASYSNRFSGYNQRTWWYLGLLIAVRLHLGRRPRAGFMAIWDLVWDYGLGPLRTFSWWSRRPRLWLLRRKQMRLLRSEGRWVIEA